MEQHPVPQNVTSFQFRLIGDMTIKQFGYLIGGVILAFVSYKLPLPFFFTWPLTVLFALAGFGFAFVPIEERPMDVWVLSFLKNVYSPTQYVWHRMPTPPAAPIAAAAPAPVVPLSPPLSASPPVAAPAPVIPPKPEIKTVPMAAGSTVKIIPPDAVTKAGLPRLTTFSNVVTGIVKDNQGSLLPGVLVTIKNTEQIPLRALKTNKLGQFAASTQLPNGVYVVEIEDPRSRFVFDRAQITLNGTVMPPLEILAKSKRDLEREQLTKQIFGQTMNS